MNSDSLDELGYVNPVDVSQLSMESHGRIRARVMEGVAGHAALRRSKGRRLEVMAAVAIVGVLGMIFLGGRLGVGPGPAPGATGDPNSASCVDPYRGPDSIKRRAFAFDGTVEEINGDQVKFAIAHSYRGGNAPAVTLQATGMTGLAITSAGGPTLTVGTRYLVAGDDHFVWACGYTQPFNQTVAAQWAAAMGG